MCPLLWWVSPLLRWVPSLLWGRNSLSFLLRSTCLSNGRLDGLDVVLHAPLDAVVLRLYVPGAEFQLVQLLAQRQTMQGATVAQAVARIAAFDIGGLAEVFTDEPAHAWLCT